MGNGTPLGRVRGLGSARQGPHHWLLQRFTAAGNLVSVGFLAISFALLPDLSHETVTAWIAQPLVVTLLALMIVSVFWHARLGLQVLVEDYFHASATRFAAIFALNLLAFAGAAFAIISLLQIFVSATGASAIDAAMQSMSAAMQGSGM